MTSPIIKMQLPLLWLDLVKQKYIMETRDAEHHHANSQRKRRRSSITDDTLQMYRN